MTNSQLSITEPKKQKQKRKRTKQITRTGTESQKWRPHGGLSAGRGENEGEKVQGIRSINGRYKVDRGKLRIVGKWRRQRTYMYDPWT